MPQASESAKNSSKSLSPIFKSLNQKIAKLEKDNTRLTKEHNDLKLKQDKYHNDQESFMQTQQEQQRVHADLSKKQSLQLQQLQKSVKNVTDSVAKLPDASSVSTSVTVSRESRANGPLASPAESLSLPSNKPENNIMSVSVTESAINLNSAVEILQKPLEVLKEIGCKLLEVQRQSLEVTAETKREAAESNASSVDAKKRDIDLLAYHE